MLADIATGAVRLHKLGISMIERCAGYWVPSGTIARTLAQRVFPVIYDLLGASKVTTAEALALGFPVRRLEPGQRRGYHWRLPEQAPERAALILEELAREGMQGPEDLAGRAERGLGEVQHLPATFRGKRTWICCPEHADKDPSALVNPSGLVYCFSCNRAVGQGRVDGNEVVYRRFTGEIIPRPLQARTRARGGSFSGSSVSSSEAECCDPPDTTLPPPPPEPTPPGPYSTRAVASAGMPGPIPAWTAKDKPTGVLIPADDPEGHDFVRQPMSMGHVLARRYGDEGLTRRSRRGMQRSYSSKRDLLDVLRAAQKREAGPSSLTRAWDGAARFEGSWVRDHRAYLPDLYVSLDFHTHEATRAVPVQGSERDAYVLVPERFEARAGRWVGVDLDGFDGAPVDDRALAEAAQRIAAALERHPCFTGRMGLVRTSHRGVQVVAELTHTRWDLDAFYADPSVQRMLAGLDTLCLREVHEAGFTGGWADPSVHAPGRMMRRPGARLQKDGSPYVARLVWTTP